MLSIGAVEPCTQRQLLKPLEAHATVAVLALLSGVGIFAYLLVSMTLAD